MSLAIEQRDLEGIVVLDLKGQLTIGDGDIALRDRLTLLGHSGKYRVVLDLSGVDYIDSSGLGTLVFALTRMVKHHGRLALSNVNQAHLKLFLLTKLALAFEFFHDDHDAVNSFYPDRAIQHFDILEFVEQQEAMAAPR